MPNPYTPPKFRVADHLADAGPRPRAVTLALLCIGVLVGVECYHQVMRLTEVLCPSFCQGMARGHSRSESRWF